MMIEVTSKEAVYIIAAIEMNIFELNDLAEQHKQTSIIRVIEDYKKELSELKEYIEDAKNAYNEGLITDTSGCFKHGIIMNIVQR